MEDEESDGEGVGPVVIQGADGSLDEWDERVRRSVAETNAAKHGFIFQADE